jgi:V8-like Glu-specific endopeptidase
MRKMLIPSLVFVGCFTAVAASAADTVVTNSAPGGPVDFANAKPMPLPKSAKRPTGLAKALTTSVVFKGKPGSTNGWRGSGAMKPVHLPYNRHLAEEETAPSGFSSQQFGTANHPFTTARANAVGNMTAKYYPFRAAGKLFFNIGSSTYVCSASLIKRGLVVTAAHCVADFGNSTWYSNWQFVPAYHNGWAPYGTWNTRQRTIMSSYFNGTDNCAVSGVVCENDIAILEIAASAGDYPGTRTGWYGYAYNGYGFTGTGVADGNLGHITQLGYPVALDNGELMERTDSYSYTDSALAMNNVIGSQQSGGSSGGPWLINFGDTPAVTGADGAAGSEAASNRVVGVTSWGYTDPAVRQQGASAFTSNIVTLVNAACNKALSASVCN